MNVTRQPGIYIHIPFCQAKCGYCDFYSTEDITERDAFLKALIHEIKLTTPHLSGSSEFDSLYIGGGTPSLLPVSALDKVLDAVYKSYKITADCETTIEINPGTVNRNKLKYYNKLGINRISIGVQSFIDTDLQILGRIHTVADAERVIDEVRESDFSNINLDLIFALPNHKQENWVHTLERALSVHPEHLSIYNLTYEPGTPFYQKLRRGQFISFNDQAEAKYYTIAHSVLGKEGYIHYEVSNYARSEKHVSRHNYKYWLHVPYVGFGPSAHSFWNNSRWSNIASVNDYIFQLNRNILPRTMTEKLNNQQLRFENIFLSLRTYQGLSLHNFNHTFGMDFISVYEGEINHLIEKQFAEIKNDHFRLTEKGMLVCDEILPVFATI